MNGFLNPYNFISFPKQRAEKYNNTDKHTGYIEYEITTKKPLFIPNSSSDRAFRKSDEVEEHKSYDFFSYTDLNPLERYDKEYHEPVIPGSEIRGVVRSVYETLTDSCMGVLNEDEHPVKRTAEMFSPGLLCRSANQTFSLLPARSNRVGVAEELDEDTNEYPHPKGFQKRRNGDIEKQKDKKDTYLIKWGMGVEKKYYHRFVKKSDHVVKELSRDTIERKMSRVLDSYLSQSALSEENKQAYEEYEKDFKDFLNGKNGQYFPVNYSEVKNSDILYLSPACFTKEITENTIGSLAGEFAPCKEHNCPACDLFGYVGKDNTTSRGSKVRFTDLYVTEKREPKDYYNQEITLQPLSGPKTGNVEFYLQKPKNANFWTYDYHITNEKNLVVENGKLRGRKYYWHHRKLELDKNIEPTNLNKTIRPLKENITFKGKLYFDGISNKQINQLIWILNSGSEGLGLKLGAAKPLGFGSITCNITEVMERKIESNYKIVPLSKDGITYESAEFSKSVKDEFYKIAGLNSVPENVEITYPKTIEQKKSGESLTEGFNWFTNNHVIPSIGSRKDMTIMESLPHILDKNILLSYNETKEENEDSK